MDKDISAAIETCLGSERFHACYIYGETSCGKTYEVEQALKAIKQPAKFVSTHITPLGLYILLHNNNGEVIVFDDLDKLDDTTIAILKAALWEVNGERKVCWLTTSKILIEQGIPDKFIFDGKIIITSNDEKIHKKLEPVLARMLVINKKVTLEEFGNIIDIIFDKYKQDATLFKANYLNIYTEGLHLRNVIKYCEYMAKGYVQQAEQLFSVNEHFKFFETYYENHTINYIIEMFRLRFGLARTTFFRYWKKYKMLKETGWK